MANLVGLFKNEKEVERRPAGSTILEVGAPATCMYVVRSGQVAIRVGTLTVETVGEGGLVGEMRWWTTARAARPRWRSPTAS
jgi:CRP-like cAMP-binding protein